jgi:predicted nucleic acid-binding protein
MIVVTDANLLASLVIPLAYSRQASLRVESWKRAGIDLFAPLLCEYELISVLRKAVANNLLSGEEALASLKKLSVIGIRMIAPSTELHRLALHWADQVHQPVAYDAQYLALAEQNKAELWTADRRLSNAAWQVGATWVHWLGE